MNKTRENKNLGISKMDLEILVTNSNDQEIVKSFEEKLENCDLSRSAIELVNKDDLPAISRITESITAKYQTDISTNYQKYFILGFTTFFLSTLLFFIFMDEENGSLSHTTSEETKKIIPVHSNQITELTKTKLTDNNNQAKSDSETSIEKNDFQKIKQEVNKSKIKVSNQISPPTAKNSNNDTILKEKVKRTKKDQTSYPKNTTINLEYSKLERKVQSIKVMQAIPNKYKNEAYSSSDLVEYQGGDTKLEEILLEKFRNKIKDKDVTLKHSTVVFKFNVSSKGKIREVNIQSLVTPELESRIKKTVFNLSSWDKGRKRIPKDYTVYITFK